MGEVEIGDPGVAKEVEKEIHQPIDALIVFGAGVQSDQDLIERGIGEHLLGEPGTGWRMGMAAKLRVIATAELILENKVGDVVLTGGKTSEHQGIDFSEAVAMKRYLKHLLVRGWSRKIKQSEPGLTPEEIRDRASERWAETEERIILEDKSTNTIENFSFVTNLLDREPDKYRKIGFLSNNFHLDRIMKLAGKFGVKGVPIKGDDLAADVDPRLRDVVERYFTDDEKNTRFRQRILLALETERDAEIAQADPEDEVAIREIREKWQKTFAQINKRLGSEVKNFGKSEQKWSDALDKIPEYWLPCVRFVENRGRLDDMLSAARKDGKAEEVLDAHGLANSDGLSTEDIQGSLAGIKRKMP